MKTTTANIIALLIAPLTANMSSRSPQTKSRGN